MAWERALRVPSTWFAAQEDDVAGQSAEPPPVNTGLEPATIDPERQAQARRYARQKQALMLVNLGISAILVAIVLLSGLSFALRDALAAALGGLAAWAPVAGW